LTGRLDVPGNEREENMIDERFSAEAFERSACDSKELCRLLRDEILKEIDDALVPVMLDLIKQMNAMGHDLSIYDLHSGSTEFTEPFNDGEKHEYDYKILIGTDTTITIGYRS
jgi:hypothetical protein